MEWLAEASNPVMLPGEDTITMKTFALISHDHKKVDLLAWANYNRVTLQRFRVVATGTTGRLLREKVGAA